MAHAASAIFVNPCTTHTGSSSVVSVQSTSPAGVYGINDTVDISVTMNSQIEDGDHSHHIVSHTRVKLETGNVDRFAEYSSYAGSVLVYYRYTVQAGDESDDLDYESRNALHWVVRHKAERTNSVYTFRPTDDNSLNINCRLPGPGTTNSLADTSAIVVDGIAPRAANITIAPPSGGYAKGDRIKLDANFGETVVYSGAAPTLRLDLGGEDTRSAAYESGNNSDTLTFAYRVQAGDAASDLDYDGTMALATAGDLTDLAGNGANLTLPASGLISRSGPVTVDGTIPSVVSVSSPTANATYAANAYVNVTVMFDELVFVKGAPKLELATGGAGRNATYASGNGSAVLAFDYTVVRGDRTDDLDYAGTGALSLNGGAVRDAAGNAANLTLPYPGGDGSLGRSRDIRIDAVRPSVVSVSSPTANATYAANAYVNVTVMFDEPVFVKGAPKLELATGGAGRNATYASGNGSAVLAFDYTVVRGDRTDDLDYAGTGALSLNGGTIMNANGNPANLTLPYPGGDGSLGHSKDIGIDAAAPFVLSVSSPDGNGTYGTGRIVEIAVLLDGPAALYGEPRLLLDTDPPRHAEYAGGGNGTADIRFLYTVRPGDEAARLDYAGIGALSLGGGSIAYAASIYMSDTLPLPEPGSPGSLGDSSSIGVLGGPLPVLAANGSAVDDSENSGSAYRALGGATGVDVIESGGGALALVAASTEGGAPNPGAVQLIRVHPNGTLSPGGIVRNDAGNSLYQPVFVAAFEMGGLARAIVSAGVGISLLDVHPNGTVSINDTATNNGNSPGGMFDRLGNPEGASVFEAYGSTYAIVASSPLGESGLQLARILPNGTLSANGSAADGDGGLALDGASSAVVIRAGDGDAAGGPPRALVASPAAGVVQLVTVHPNGTMSRNGSAANGAGGFDALARPGEVAVFAVGGEGGENAGAGGRTHALVASSADRAVQLVRIHPNGTLAAVGSAANGTGGFDSIAYVLGIAVFEMGGWTYAVASSFGDDGIQLFRIDQDGTLVAEGSAADGARGFDALDQAEDLAVFSAGNRTYAMVASQGDNAVQLVRLSPASVTDVSSPLQGGPHPAGTSINITVGFDEPVMLSDPAHPPALLLSLAEGIDRTAGYLSGNGTAGLVFNYTVRPGDASSSLEYANAGALVSRGAVTDLLGNPVDMGLPPPGEPGSLGRTSSVGIDTEAPSAVSVSSPNASALYGTGSYITVTVRFDEAVYVEGTPLLGLDAGGAGDARHARYEGGDGTHVLSFNYTVLPGDNATRLGYANTTALSNNGGAIRDRAGNDAGLALPPPGSPDSLGGSNNIEIDGVAPVVLSVSSPDGRGETYALGNSIRIVVRFSEPVNATGMPELELETGMTDRSAAYAPGTSASAAELAFLYKVQDGDEAARLDYTGTGALSLGGGTIRDAAGNDASLMLPPPGDPRSLGHSNDFEIDGVSPTVLSVSLPGDDDEAYTRGDSIRIAVMFSEAVYVDEANGAPPPTIALDTGAAGGARTAAYDASGSAGMTLAFTYAVQDGDDTDGLDYANTTALSSNGAAIADAAGNNASLTLPPPGSPDSLGGSNNIRIDGVLPTVLSVSSPDDDGAYGIAARINITVTFSEDVRVTGSPALVLDAGAANRTATYDPAGSDGRTLAFVYTVRPGDGTADLEYAGTGALIPRGATILDDAGNGANLALPRPGDPDSLGGSKDIAIDTAAPARPGDPARVLLVESPDAGGTYGAGYAVNITVAFTRDVRVSGTPPLLALSTDPPRSAGYVQGTDGYDDELSFLYVVQPGDSADPLGYANSSALYLDGATIRDSDGNDAILVMPAPGSALSLSALHIAVDGVAPAVDGVTSPDADGTYGVGSRINITVSFDEPVMVTGSPRILLDAGAAGRHAAYDHADSDGRTLAFEYTVRPGDSAADLEYAGTGALAAGAAAAGAAIADNAGNNANLTLPRPGSPGSLGGSKDIAIDTAAPARPGDPARVLLVHSPDAGGLYGPGTAVNITVAFTRDVRVSGTPPLLALSTDPPRSAGYVQGTDGYDDELSFLYVVQPGDSADPLDYANSSALLINGAMIRDSDGNDAGLALPAPGSPQSLSVSGIVIGSSTGNGGTGNGGTGNGGTGNGGTGNGGTGNGGTDPPAPVAVSVQARGGGGGGAPGPYSAGQAIAIGIEFSAPVTVRASAGTGATPYLELRTGSAGARAAYDGGNNTRTLEFVYAVRGGDLTERLLYAGASALILNGSSITSVGTGEAASVALPEPGSPGSLSEPGGPAVRIDPEPGRPVLQIGVLDEEVHVGSVSMAAAAAAAAFNERQGRTDAALLVNATSYNAGNTAVSAVIALRAAHSSGAGPSVYVGPSTDRGLHAAMPYAAENEIVLVSAGSTAPSLAVEDDLVFRLLPSARLDAEALARHALNAGSESLHAVLENATHGPPTAAGQTLEDATPPAPGGFSHAFDAALAYAGVPALSGTVTLAGAAGSYGAAEAAEALDASVNSASARAAVVYMGSPEGLAALAAASGQYPALASAVWLATGPSAGSLLLAGDGPAAAFAAQAGLSAAHWSPSTGSPAREIDPLLPPGADAGARHRAYAAYDAVLVIGEAAAGARGGDGTVDAAENCGPHPGRGSRVRGRARRHCPGPTRATCGCRPSTACGPWRRPEPAAPNGRSSRAGSTRSAHARSP